MWNHTKSLFLSKVLTLSATGAVIIMTFFIPGITKWYEQISVGTSVFGSRRIFIPMCVCMYFCEALLLTVLFFLHRLLNNIGRNRIFIPQNTACLRIISWACIVAGFALLIFGLWRLVFVLGAFLAFMIGLVIRVLKNVFEKAVEIKTENDFTV